MATPKNATPDVSFDWHIYADATFAGLSILIPVPLVDAAFEQFFRRRMPNTIAKYNGMSLSPRTRLELNRGRFNCLTACLLWPLIVVFVFLKRLSRKLLYFLTIKEASDQLSVYWHRAFLLDYMCKAGYLDDEETAVPAAEALREILDTITTSPLNQLARQIVAIPHRVIRSLRRARRGEADADINEARSRMAQTWAGFADYFMELAQQYDQTYLNLPIQLVENSPQSTATPPPDTPQTATDQEGTHASDS